MNVQSKPHCERGISVLKKLVDELRAVKSSVEFDSMDGHVAYYSALESVATCIEEAIKSASASAPEQDPFEEEYRRAGNSR